MITDRTFSAEYAFHIESVLKDNTAVLLHTVSKYRQIQFYSKLYQESVFGFVCQAYNDVIDNRRTFHQKASWKFSLSDCSLGL